MKSLIEFLTEEKDTPIEYKDDWTDTFDMKQSEIKKTVITALKVMNLEDKDLKSIIAAINKVNTKSVNSVMSIDGEDVKYIADSNYSRTKAELEKVLNGLIICFQPKDDRFDTFKEGIKAKRIIIMDFNNRYFYDASTESSSDVKYKEGDTSTDRPKWDSKPNAADVCYFIQQRDKATTTGYEYSNWFITGIY